MNALIKLQIISRQLFAFIERATDGWLLGLFARVVFLAVLYLYYLNSALTKVGDGFSGFFSIQVGAYYQIAMPAIEAAGGDPSAVPFFPWGLVVVLGTYAEFVLPLLVVVGLFTRVAAIGMIGFVLVQSLVDVTIHKVDATTIGALFDRFPDSVILDQRLLWIFLLTYLAMKGAGIFSLDRVLSEFLLRVQESEHENPTSPIGR
jgi:putative oxidoreductase